MRVILDTCSFLWIAIGSDRLSVRARQVFADPANEVLLSAASVWEIAVKYSLGRLSLPAPPEEFVPNQRRLHGIETLDIDEASALYESRLPRIHADPFDRILICQAIEHACALLTPDEHIAKYPVRVIW